MNDTLTAILCVAAGGAIGAVLRYLAYRYIDTEFPWATFIVNLVGCTLSAFIFFKIGSFDENVRLFIFIGFFGAFTTMSTFSLDTVKMFANELYVDALLNFILNAVLCVGGAFLGRWLALL